MSVKKVLVPFCILMIAFTLCACGVEDKPVIGEGTVISIVRVRKAPSVDAEIVDVLEEGQKVNILAEEDDFYQISAQAEGKTQDTGETIEGYVRKKFILKN
ncbi:MAG: SH3 domain-containing protein [Bacteroidales bacterium]|nr:SH3 domain-containing protein [Lachnoclostridium sp.]MCM1383914.1 SH3 domain-containing protein [Lachnoclostridium sp.]MCM1464436.1 SH3 domain-containing protein [Bacteroidales bacterium]